MNKQNKKMQNVEHDYVTNRVLTMFGGGILLIAFTTYLRNCLTYASSITTGLVASKIGVYLGIAGFVFGLIWNVTALKKGKYNHETLFNGTGLMMFGVLLAICSWMITGLGVERATRIAYILIPVCALLYLIYSVYLREFFTVAAGLTGVVFCAWLVMQTHGSTSFSGIVVVFLALGLVICLLMEGVYLATRKNGGKIRFGKRKIAVYGQNTRHLFVLAAVLLGAAVLAAAFFLGAPWGYYAMYTLIGVIFIEAVYYTVKMM
ncbi:hypothetical protein [Acidaminobacterium chupaoyuni]